MENLEEKIQSVFQVIIVIAFVAGSLVLFNKEHPIWALVCLVAAIFFGISDSDVDGDGDTCDPSAGGYM